jgi:DNA replication protein DnaC
MTTNEKNCLLSSVCKVAGDPSACTARCVFFVNFHGESGHGSIVSRANVPKDYRMLTISNSPARDSEVLVVLGDRDEDKREMSLARVMQDYVNTFSRQFEDGAESIKSFYLYSPSPGTGKTTTAAALLNEYLIRHYLGSKLRELRPMDQPGYFLSMNRWHSKFHEFNRRNVPEHIGNEAADEYYITHRIAKKVPFLVIDDIGVRQASDAFNMDVLDLVDHRVSNRLPTVYTSNVPVEALSDIYDDRVFDRVRDMCLPVKFVGDSHRGLIR